LQCEEGFLQFPGDGLFTGQMGQLDQLLREVLAPWA
jgi:hypothetical protein